MKDKSNLKDDVLRVRIKKQQKVELQSIAHKQGKTLSEFVRTCVSSYLATANKCKEEV
jgi:uncharacterized protein (DUF1778 family)